MDVAERVLEFWFDEADLDLAADGVAREAWFKKDEAFDQAIRDGFLADVEKAAAGGLDDLQDTAAGSLALCILLDQFPRNLFRGEARAFATDAKALDIARNAVAKGFDKELGQHQRMFIYLPYEHSEDLDVQVESVELIRSMAEDYYRYALEHYYVISRFGRFPGRNAALGRESTAEEKAFLDGFSAF